MRYSGLSGCDSGSSLLLAFRVNAIGKEVGRSAEHTTFTAEADIFMLLPSSPAWTIAHISMHSKESPSAPQMAQAQRNPAFQRPQLEIWPSCISKAAVALNTA